MSLPRRRKSRAVAVGGVVIGGGAPIVVQSMTNTDTVDAEATARQVEALARAGSEIVRITVNSPEAAAKVEAEVRARHHAAMNPTPATPAGAPADAAAAAASSSTTEAKGAKGKGRAEPASRNGEA